MDEKRLKKVVFFLLEDAYRRGFQQGHLSASRLSRDSNDGPVTQKQIYEWRHHRSRHDYIPAGMTRNTMDSMLKGSKIRKHQRFNHAHTSEILDEFRDVLDFLEI